MKVNRHISLDTRFNLPTDLSSVRHKGKWIICAPECFNYIVLANDAQRDFFFLLKDFTLGEARSRIDISDDDAKAVLVQVVAKRFEESRPPKAIGDLQLHFYLTNACNLRCRHCYMFSAARRENELSPDEVESILRSFASGGGKIVIFSGGEVATRPDLPDILRCARSLGLNVNIMTNGTLWTERMVSELAPFLSSAQVSIDGYDEASNAKVRGAGNFKKSIDAVDSFLRRGVKVVVAVTPWYDESLFGHKDDFLSFKHAMLKKYEGLPLEFKYTSDIMKGRDLHLTKEQHQRYFDFMQEVSNADLGNLYAENFIFNQRNKVVKDCWCTFGHLTISSDGDVYLCGKVNMVKPLCNVRRTSMESIMRVAAKGRELAKVQYLNPCGNCELRFICGADCRIDHFEWFRDSADIADRPLTPGQFSRRCDISVKQRYYDLMIENNDRLFQ